jgi:hypothetical protein
MPTDVATAQADLAYMRALVADQGRSQMAFGLIYLAGGLIYGAQLLVNWAQSTGALVLSPAQTVAVIGGANLVFFAAYLVALLRFRPSAVTLATRAFYAGFSGVAAAILTLSAVFGLYALRTGGTEPWLMFAPVVFALQGSGWITGFLLRRRGWLLLVALGWLATALLGAWLGAQPVVALLYAVGLLLWMAAPGAVMVLQARRQA